MLFSRAGRDDSDDFFAIIVLPDTPVFHVHGAN
jgi:hypothetical protein